MKELEEMKKCFDEFMAKAEQTLVRIKGTAQKEILDKEEKEYLEAVIRPFRKQTKWIAKKTAYGEEHLAFLEIAIKEYGKNTDYINMPSFKKDTMYKGMELDKEYTLEELGLFKGE